MRLVDSIKKKWSVHLEGIHTELIGFIQVNTKQCTPYSARVRQSTLTKYSKSGSLIIEMIKRLCADLEIFTYVGTQHTPSLPCQPTNCNLTLTNKIQSTCVVSNERRWTTRRKQKTEKINTFRYLISICQFEYL